MRKLIDTKEGEIVRVEKINAEREIRERLMSFGFLRGEKLKILMKGKGFIIVSIKSSIVAIDSEIGEKIWVS